MQRINKQPYLLTTFSNKHPLSKIEREHYNTFLDYIGLYKNLKHTFPSKRVNFKITDSPGAVLTHICSEISKSLPDNIEWTFIKDSETGDCKFVEYYSLQFGRDVLFPLPIGFMMKLETKNKRLFNIIKGFLLNFTNILFNTTGLDSNDYYIEMLQERIDYSEDTNDTNFATDIDIDKCKNDIMIFKYCETSIFNNFKSSDKNIYTWVNGLKKYRVKSIAEGKLLICIWELYQLYLKGFTLNLYDTIPPSLKDDDGIFPILSKEMFQITWNEDDHVCPLFNMLVDYFDMQIQQHGIPPIEPVVAFITDKKNKRLTKKEKDKQLDTINNLWKEYNDLMENFSSSLKTMCHEYK